MPAIGARSLDSCLPCGAGRFGNLTGQTACSPCPAGSFTEDDQAASCAACPNGGFCPDAGASSRLVFQPCPAGTYNEAVGATSNASCVACAPGKASPVPGSVSASTCSPCLPGAYANQEGAGVCTLCPEGKFTSSSGNTACNPCTQGYLCVKGSSAPQPCPGGTHANQTVLNLTGYLSSLDECVVCPAGTSCSVGSAEPAPCLPGSASAAAGAQSCTLCPAGQFQDKYGQTACTPCTLGFYCEVGTAKPTPCPGGTFSNVLSATSKAACTAVSPGFWAALGSSQPEPCPATGFFCPGKALDEKYGGSKPILVAAGGSTTTEEVETVQKDLTLDLSCAAFDLDKVKQSLAAQYNVDPLLITLTNPCATRRRARLLQSGGSGLTLTITIAATATAADGTQVSSPPVADLLSAVQSVDDASLGSSLGAALGTAITVTSTAATQATITRTVESVCPPGFWCTAGLTVACEVGFYNPTTNANNQSACLQCPEHATTLGASATGLSQCLCDVRYFNNHSNDGVLCLPCPVGTNCTAPGNTRDALPIKPGFWRKSNSTIDVRACADVAVGCSAGQSECERPQSGCTGGTDSTTPCRPGLTGVFCLVCASSDTGRPHFYVAASETAPATCSPCEESFVLPFVAAVLAAIALIVLLLAAIRSPPPYSQSMAQRGSSAMAGAGARCQAEAGLLFLPDCV